MRYLPVILASAAAFGGFAAWAAHAEDRPKTRSFGGEIKDEQGQFVIKYAGVIPLDIPPKKTLGLIVGMHGLNGDEHQQVGSITEGLTAAGIAREYMILGLKSRESGWKDEDNDRIARAIGWAVKNHPVDPRRVFTWGYSSGAFGTGRFVPRYPKLAAGGVMWAGGTWDPPKAPDGGEPDPRLYLIHGNKDATVPVDTARKTCEQLKAARYRFVYRELAGADHGLGGPGNAPCKQDAAQWIHALRNRTLPLSDDERKAVDDLATRIREGKTSPPAAAFLRLLDLAGPEVEEVVVSALRSERPDVRKAAATLCQQRQFGKTVMAALAPLVDDKDAAPRVAAVRALGIAAQWQVPEAVEALCACAKDAARTGTDRAGAVGQLGLTVPLQLFCARRDAAVFDTLAALQDDKNAQVRTIAKLAQDGKLLPEGQTVKIKP